MTLPVVALMATASPAGAQVEPTPTGVQTHIGVPYQGGPNNTPPPCARYYTYDANVTFPDGRSATVAKDPTRTDVYWDENPVGTYAPVGAAVPIPPPSQTGCSSTPGYIVRDAFKVTVVGGGFNCVGATASYSRSNFIDVKISDIKAPVLPGSCPTQLDYKIAAVRSSTLPPPLDFVAVCDGPASRTCVIGPTITIP